MSFKFPTRAGLTAVLAAAGTLAATAAYADPTVNKGDNAWLMTSAALVLLMTIPGLALFYGGLVRAKNMLSVLMHVFYSVCIVGIIWVVFGYSLAFTGGSRLDRRLLEGLPLRRDHRFDGGHLLGRRRRIRNTPTSPSR